MPSKYDKCIKYLVDISEGAWSQKEARNLYEALDHQVSSEGGFQATMKSLTPEQKRAAGFTKINAADTSLQGLMKIGEEEISKKELASKQAVVRKVLANQKLDTYLERSKGYKSPREFLESLYGGIEKVREGSRGGVDGKITSNTADTMRRFRQAIDRIESPEGTKAYDLFKDGELDERMLWKKRQLEGVTEDYKGEPKHSDGVADKVAEVYHDFNTRLVDRQNASGAGIAKLKGRGTMQWNNAATMLHGGEAKWKSFVGPLLDQTMVAKDHDRFMSSVYDAVTTGTRLAREGDVDGAFKSYSKDIGGGSANRERVLHFAGYQEQLRYLKSEYSHGSMFKATLDDIAKAERNATMFESLTTDPAGFHDKLVEELAQQERKGVSSSGEDKADLSRIKSLDDISHADAILKNITGFTSHDVNPNKSALVGGWKAYQNTITLTNSILRVFPDLVNGPAELAIRGMPYWQAVHTYYRGLFSSLMQGLGSKERMQNYEECKSFIDEMQRHIAMNKFNEMGGVKGMFDGQTYPISERIKAGTAAANATLFHYNQMHNWDNWLMQTSRDAQTSWLGKNADRAFSAIDNKGFARSLKVYGIDENAWNTIRKAAYEVEGQGKALTGDAVRGLSDEDINEYLSKQGKGTTEAGRERARAELATLTNTYIYDAGSHTIMHPDAATRAYTNQGMQQGTTNRILLDLVFQMKGFMITNARKNLGRAIYGGGSENLWEAMQNKNGELTQLANNLVQGTMLYMAGDVLYTLGRGYTPPNQLNAKQQLKNVLGGGGAGIYMETILRDYDHGASFTASLAGPTASTIDRAMKLGSGYKNAALGEGKAPNAQSIQFAADSVPGLRTVGVRPLINYLVINRLREMASPGSVKRTQKEIKKQTGSTSLLPPQ